MSNVAHWPDDMDDALGGDFDGSLSSLCIMSLSLDFTRNGCGQHMGSSRENIAGYGGFHQVSGGLLGTPASAGSKALSYGINASHDAHNDNSNNCFKRFKRSIANDTNHEEDGRSNKTIRQHQLKNCLSNNSPQTANTISAHYSNAAPGNPSQVNDELEQDRLTPQSPGNRASDVSTPSGSSSRSSTVGDRTPSPSQSCSSISTHSPSSSRSQSPSDMSIHSSNAINANNNNAVAANQSANKNAHNGSEPKSSANNNDNNQQVSIYSVKDSLLNGSTLKESSYTTSVITTTAPMHFKNLQHPFSLKSTLSPYHQFSNSSLNLDFYDRYLSRDGHQPLQTPLIGLERTQDLLSLKLPPHGHDDDFQRFPKDWPFEDTKHESELTRAKSDSTLEKARGDNNAVTGSNIDLQDSSKKKAAAPESGLDLQKGFPFNYKSNSSLNSTSDRMDKQTKSVDLNVTYDQGGCCSTGEKYNMFNESMKHFNPDRVQRNACYDPRSSKNDSLDQESDHCNDGDNVASQYHGQESMFGMDPSKQKFQYLLAAPISVATKLNEDTMTYLNQAQAYEIKLENMTDVSEAKKGFMCSVINIGFHERHMQQAEHELWQQWSQQHPNEKIFSVDMKLSYNVFGVESDGLNKYEFLWDSSKAAGVFIRINSISTEFTPKKHGGEKGVPFKLSIETFSYNSKTHDSYFISAACCQIKVFKPKGAERKIKSDRDKILKRPSIEQDKYHRPCDHTSFRECSLTSLHPMVDGSLCDYRHSHGHFASKQIVTTGGSAGTPMTQTHNQSVANHQQDDDVDHVNNTSQLDRSPERSRSSDRNGASQDNNENEINSQGGAHHRDYQNHNNMNNSPKINHTDYRLAQQSHYSRGNLDHHQDHHGYGHNQNQHSPSEASFSHSNELSPNSQSTTAFNQIQQNNQARSVASLTGINNSQHFNIAYYGHSLPTSIPPLSIAVPPGTNYGTSSSNSINSASQSNHHFSPQSQQHQATGARGAINYRAINDKTVNQSQTTHNSNFKVSNLALTSHNNNFQTYLGTNNEQCNISPTHELPKDGSLNTNNYQHDNYDSHLHQSFQAGNSHSQQQLSRQRSSSISNWQCTSYLNHASQNRHLDGYNGSSNNPPFENAAASIHWSHYGPTNHHSNLPNANSVCSTRDGSNTLPIDHDSHAYNNEHNYDFSHEHYSGQNSPQKNHQHTNDSAGSCCSRFKVGASMIHRSPQVEGVRHHNPLITINSNCSEVVSWLNVNRFGVLIKTFNNFSGSDLLRLSKTELIEICGLIDGIRLYNNLHNQPIKPRRVIYICHKSSDIFIPIYLYDLTLKELLRELSVNFGPYLTNDGSAANSDRKGLEKSTVNSNSSADSRSSMEALSSETINEDVYNHSEHFFHDSEMERHRKCQANDLKNSRESGNISQAITIGRLLIDGITSVKIVATEQVVQVLENESAWKLSFGSDKHSGSIEALLTVSRSKKAPT